MGKNDKQKMNIFDFGGVTTSHIPNTLEDAEAKGQFAQPRMMGGRDGGRGGREGDDDRRGGRRMMMDDRQGRPELSDADLTFTRGTMKNDVRGERRESRDFDAPPAELTFTRGARQNVATEKPRRQMVDDSELTFSRGAKKTETDGGLMTRGSRAGAVGTSSTGGFQRGARLADAQPTGQTGGLMTRAKRGDGMTLLQRRKAEEESRKAEEEKRELERVQADAERKHREAEAARAKAEAAEAERLALEAKRKSFQPPEFRKPVMETLNNTMTTCLGARDFAPLRVLCESLDHDTYNAAGTFLLPFIIQVFRYAFVQEGKMSTEDFKTVIVNALCAMSPLFQKTQLQAETIEKRILWEVASINQLFNGACLNEKTHIADAVLQSFVAAEVLSKPTANQWFEMRFNKDVEAPKNASDIWRYNQKYMRGVSKLVSQ